MSKPKIVIVSSADEESFYVVVNGIEVGSANYDEHGWSGMTAIRKILKKTAKAADLKFTEVYREHDE